MKVQITFLFLLILSVLFHTLCQTLYAQNEIPNTTLQLDHNTTNTESNSSSDPTSVTNRADKLNVMPSFFPIGEFIKKVGGDRVESSLLIPKGVEPHDFEPTINQIQTADTADVLVYNGLGIDNWIAKINTANRIDASEGINATYVDKRNMTLDPPVWLDPILAKKEAENIRDGFIRIDPTNKNFYINNTRIFLNELDNLDKAIRTQLESCKKKDFISFHNAFSYFAKRYELNQHSISSTPETEVTPQHLAEIINTAKSIHLNIIYSEELIDPRYASVVAQELPNGKVLVLSPIEGLTKAEQASGIGYLDKMQENVKNLMEGLECNQ
ncbi:MAG TPA: zinc ABC transporter substrate-binding protein [Nitrososphaeraceae archaeon]